MVEVKKVLNVNVKVLQQSCHKTMTTLILPPSHHPCSPHQSMQWVESTEQWLSSKHFSPKPTNCPAMMRWLLMRYSSLHTCWQPSRNKPTGNLFLNIEPDAKATLRLFRQLWVKHGSVLIKSCENSLMFGVIFKISRYFCWSCYKEDWFCFDSGLACSSFVILTSQIIWTFPLECTTEIAARMYNSKCTTCITFHILLGTWRTGPLLL